MSCLAEFSGVTPRPEKSGHQALCTLQRKNNTAESAGVLSKRAELGITRIVSDSRVKGFLQRTN